MVRGLKEYIMILAVNNNVNFKRKDLGYIRPRANFHLSNIVRRMSEGTRYEGHKIKRLTQLTLRQTGDTFQFSVDTDHRTLIMQDPPVKLTFDRNGTVLSIKKQNFLLRLKNRLLGKSKYLLIKRQEAIDIAGHTLRAIDNDINDTEKVVKTFSDATLAHSKRH